MRKSWVIAVVVLLLFTGGGAAAAAYYYGQDNRLPADISVGALQLGGRSPDQALARLQERIRSLEDVDVSVSPAQQNGVSSAKLPARSLKQLGMKISAAEAVRALEQYRDRSWWERALQRLQGESSVSYNVSVTWDDALLKRGAETAWGAAVHDTPQEAKREINANDVVVYTPEIVGKQVDLPALTAEVKKLAPVSLAEAGRTQAISVRLPVTDRVPAVTVASLKEQGVERKIAEFTTSFTTSAAGRSHNVTVAAKALNDTVLQPDEEFEYGKIVAKAEKVYGYREAPVIVKGKLTPGVGGGICQVSSTLYNAILQVGLDVLERRNHSLVVHYLPPGLDATFADGFVNFRFRNSTGKQLIIRTEVHNKHLTVKLFGTLPDNVSYKTETQQVKVVQPQIKYVADSKIEPGKQKRLQKGANGYVVDTFRIKLVDGKAVTRDKMPRSNYKPQDELIAVHPDDPHLKPKNPQNPAATPDPAPTPADQQNTPVEPV